MDDMNQFIEATGVLCEISSVMRDMLIKNGYTRDEAVDISGKYLIYSFMKATGGKTNDK